MWLRSSLRNFCWTGVVVCVAMVLLGNVGVAAAPQVTFTVYPITGNPVWPPSITSGPDGALWFSMFSAIGRITTAGAVTQYPLPRPPNVFNRSAIDITPGPDGALWYVDSSVGKVGRITTTGVITEYALANERRWPMSITTGPDGALWFGEAVNGEGRIGRITTDGVISEYRLTACQGTCGRYPNSIAVGPDGALWFTDLGDDRLHKITTAGVVTDYGLAAIGNEGYAPGGIVSGPDGALWFTGSGGNDAIGRITTSGVMTLFPLPWYPRASYNGYNNLEPRELTVGPDKALWFIAGRAPVLGRITTQGEVSFYPLPLGLTSDYTMPASITLGPDGALWIGDYAYIIRAAVQSDTTPPAMTLRVSPTRLWPADGRMVRVTLAGRVTDAGSGVRASSVEYAVFDDYGVVQPSGHLSIDGSGNFSADFLLQSSRYESDADGRRYLIRLRAKDMSGNGATRWASVTVPHDVR